MRQTQTGPRLKPRALQCTSPSPERAFWNSSVPVGRDLAACAQMGALATSSVNLDGFRVTPADGSWRHSYLSSTNNEKQPSPHGVFTRPNRLVVYLGRRD